MNAQKRKMEQRLRRKKRVRAKIFGTSTKPRLSVFRSLRYISAQVIDDSRGRTIVSVHSKDLKLPGNTIETASRVGEEIAKRTLQAGIKSVVFDKSFYAYHGRIRALADAARKAGLKF